MPGPPGDSREGPADKTDITVNMKRVSDANRGSKDPIYVPHMALGRGQPEHDIMKTENKNRKVVWQIGNKHGNKGATTQSTRVPGTVNLSQITAGKSSLPLTHSLQDLVEQDPPAR